MEGRKEGRISAATQPSPMCEELAYIYIYTHTPKNWCFWTVILEKTLESALDCKEIKPVNHKGNQSWMFIGRTYAKAPILWPPDVKNWLIGEDPDAGKDWRREEKGVTEYEMFGWHHWLDGHEFEQALGVSDEQGGLGCCSPLGCKESDTTERLNWTELIYIYLSIYQRQLSSIIFRDRFHDSIWNRA